MSDRPTLLGGDHIYKMDIRQMLNYHRGREAACTVAAVPFDRDKAARNYGIIEVDAEWRITGFEEKPADPKPIPGMPDKALVSMGNYLFRTGDLEQALNADAADAKSAHDFGRDVIPAMVGHLPVYAYNFLDNFVPGELPTARATGVTWARSTHSMTPTWT
jgi:glucose-1-phosphate adenylyltransferase